MINKIGHYSLENPASVYDEEAMTALELAGRTAKKVNEVIDQSNTLDRDTRSWMEDVSRNQIPREVEDEVQDQIRNGTFDHQIDQALGGLNERVDNLLGSVKEGGTTLDAEVIDGRVEFDGHVSENLGNAIRQQVKNLSHAVIQVDAPRTLVFDDLVEGKVYSTQNGALVNGEGWKCSRNLVPCDEHILFTCEEQTGTDSFMILCYDKHMAYLGNVYIPKTGLRTSNPRVTKTGTRYIGINVKTVNEHTSFTLRPLSTKGVTLIEHSNSANMKDVCAHMPNAVANKAGSAGESETMDAIVFPVDDSIKAIYLNSQTQYNCICLDGSGNVLSTGETVGVECEKVTLATFFPIPEGTVQVHITFQHVMKHDNVYSGYISLIREGVASNIDGKRILAIGDSLTYLDHMAEDTATRYLGWQKQLRALGARVYSNGDNGATYAQRAEDSLYNTIVTDGLDVTGYDIIILEGGLNDIYYDVDLDTHLSHNGYNQTGDLTTLEGALIGIIRYIRTNNPLAEIYVCGVPHSTGSRTLEGNNKANATIERVCQSYGVPVIPLHKLMNMSSGLNDNGTLTYDWTHPNKVGMARMGKIIGRFINNNTN